MNRILYSTTLIASVLAGAFAPLPTPATAADLSSPFTAECKDTAIHQYNFYTARNGNVLGRKWITDDYYLGGFWVFRWTPPDTLTLDGRELLVIAKHDAILSAIFPEGKGVAAVNVNSYAISLPLKSVVHAHVQATSSLGESIKTLATELACVFKFG